MPREYLKETKAGEGIDYFNISENEIGIQMVLNTEVNYLDDLSQRKVIKQEEVKLKCQSNFIDNIVINVGNYPRAIVMAPDWRRVYVTNVGDSTVSVIDTKTNKVVGNSISVGLNPYNMAIMPNGKKLYVAKRDDRTITLINTKTNKVINPPIPVGKYPYKISITPNGRYEYITNFLDGTVSVVDLKAERNSCSI